MSTTKDMTMIERQYRTVVSRYDNLLCTVCRRPDCYVGIELPGWAGGHARFICMECLREMHDKALAAEIVPDDEDFNEQGDILYDQERIRTIADVG